MLANSQAEHQTTSNLPTPVRCYLELCGAGTSPRIVRVQEQQKGAMCLKRGGGWVDFTAGEWFTAEPPEFSWKARMQMGVVPFSVTDEYVGGRGRLVAGPLGLKLTEMHGPEFDEGELLRWLASTILFPTVWLSDKLQWESIDERSARVAMTHGGQTISLRVEFGTDGMVRGMNGQRYRVEGKKRARQGWQVRGGDYRPVQNWEREQALLLPHYLEAAWIEDDRVEFTYFRAEVTSLDVEFVAE
jgi:hypothetical protein